MVVLHVHHYPSEKLARRAGVGVKPIRFYERQRLFTAPMRKDSGYRLYPEHVLGRIRFIRRIG